VDNLVLYISCTTLGGAGAWLISRWGKLLGFLDSPNDRSSHTGVVPKGGGIGILAAFLVCSIVLSVPRSFWIPAVLLSLFSLWGDRSEIRPKTRLLFQFAAGVILLTWVLLEKESTALAYALVPLLAIFVVGTANYYNFMDGINGIAGITGVIGFGLLAFYASNFGADHCFIILSICMSLTCLGFLPFNMPNAKVFMGDVGSILLGFVFAAMVLWLSRDVLDFMVLSAFLFPFYADELTTLVVRIKDGDRLTRPHRKHLYQLLTNEKRISHWKISVGYGLFQLVVGVTVLLLKPFGILMVLSLLVAYFGGFVVVSSIVRRSLTVS